MMKIFKKKFDIEKDRLRIVFNSSKKIYVAYHGMNLIPHSSLNRKSQKYIDNKNKELETNFEILATELEKVASRERFDKLKSLGYTCDSFEYLGPVNGTMSKQIKELLNKLTTEENVLLGIHRIGTDDSLEKIEDILKNGLKITGHLGGAAQSNKDLNNNIGYYANNKTIIKELMYADKYKNSKGSILIRIPDEDLKQNIFINTSDGETRLNPKYIVGYVPVYKNYHLELITTLETIKKSKYSYNFQNTINENKDYYQEVPSHKIRR